MGIPLAVSPTIRGPGLYLLVNLLAGTNSPGSAPLRVLIMCPKSSAGTITANTEIRTASGPDDCKTGFGIGSPGHLTGKTLFGAHPQALCDIVAPTASAGAAATNFATFSGSPSATRTIRWTIAGRVIETTWPAGQSADVARDNSILAISQRTDDLPLTADANGSGVTRLTFKVPGPWGNDCPYKCELIDGAGGSVANNGTALAGGTTEPDFTTALSTVSGREYDLIVPCVSNADAQSASASSNPGRVKTHLGTYSTGLNAKLQQAVVGLTGALASAKTGAIGRNSEVMEYVFCKNGQSLPCEFAGAEAGDRLYNEALDPACNRIGNRLKGVYGAADLVADTPTGAEVEDALYNGVAIVGYDAQGNPIIKRPITTHSQDASGNPDARVLDTSGVSGTFAVSKDIRNNLPLAFPNAKISKNLTPTDEPLPAGVVEERDILGWIVSRLRFWSRAGVVRRDKLDEAIEAGTIIVQVNASDPTQVDIIIPLSIFPPLAKFGVVVNRTA